MAFLLLQAPAQEQGMAARVETQLHLLMCQPCWVDSDWESALQAQALYSSARML